MQTNVRSTSIHTYHETKIKRIPQRETIARYILDKTKHGKRTWGNDIERALNIRINAVTGRVNELKKNGIVLDGQPYRVLETAEPVIDPITKRPAIGLSLVLDTQIMMEI